MKFWCCYWILSSTIVIFSRSTNQWCSPRDQGLGLEAPRGQKMEVLVLVLVLDHEVLVSVLEKKSCSFSRLLLQFLTTVSKAHHGILWETAKAVCHLEAIVWENLLRSMHISLSWKGINNGGYLLGHTDASKAQCVDCGKLRSFGSNKPGKQMVEILQKCHKDTLIHWYKDTRNTRKVESRQGPPAKRRNWTRHWRRIVGLTRWLNVWKDTNIIMWLWFFVFRPKMNVHKCP